VLYSGVHTDATVQSSELPAVEDGSDLPYARQSHSTAHRYSYALSKESGSVFFSNLLQNLVAEFFGWAVGGILATVIATKLAVEKLGKLAPDLVVLIAQLRKGNTINSEAARQCVICTVGLLADDALVKARETTIPIIITKRECPVCKLDADIVRGPEGQSRCTHCHLRGDVWDRNELKI
jgi:hypothetical protein